VTLADSSVWVDHLRHDNARLSRSLVDGEIACHSFVIGELACGFLTKRTEILTLLEKLPSVPVADHDEVLRLVEARRLYGRGLGWIDMHLLASALLSRTSIWTLDKALSRAARSLGLAA
jgi:predicted nucleic acid-binding protein